MAATATSRHMSVDERISHIHAYSSIYSRDAAVKSCVDRPWSPAERRTRTGRLSYCANKRERDKVSRRESRLAHLFSNGRAMRGPGQEPLGSGSRTGSYDT